MFNCVEIFVNEPRLGSLGSWLFKWLFDCDINFVPYGIRCLRWWSNCDEVKLVPSIDHLWYVSSKFVWDSRMYHRNMLHLLIVEKTWVFLINWYWRMRINITQRKVTTIKSSSANSSFHTSSISLFWYWDTKFHSYASCICFFEIERVILQPEEALHEQRPNQYFHHPLNLSL